MCSKSLNLSSYPHWSKQFRVFSVKEFKIWSKLFKLNQLSLLKISQKNWNLGWIMWIQSNSSWMLLILSLLRLTRQKLLFKMLSIQIWIRYNVSLQKTTFRLRSELTLLGLKKSTLWKWAYIGKKKSVHQNHFRLFIKKHQANSMSKVHP